MNTRKLNLKFETVQVLSLAAVVGGAQQDPDVAKTARPAAAAEIGGQHFSKLVTPTGQCIFSCFCNAPRLD